MNTDASQAAGAWMRMRLNEPERLIGYAATIATAILMIASALLLSLWQAALLWAVLAIALAVASRQGWLKLVGPVLLYDMIRTARRERYFFMRMAYAGLLLLILVYMLLFLSLADEGQALERQRAVIAEGFFLTFTVVQLCVVVFLTPAYVSGAIAEEKDRKTLEFIMATDLRDGEIILSKMLSRLANMSLLLITGLPILAILQFMGGVDPELVLAGFAAVGLTMLGFAGTSMMVSVMTRKPRDAINLAYLVMFAYLALGTIGLIARRTPVMGAIIWPGDDAYTLKDVIDLINAGNPIAAITRVGWAIGGMTLDNTPTTLVAELPKLLTGYAWFHFGIAFVTIGYSIMRLRPIALRQGSEVKEIKQYWWQGLRPRIGVYPMLWKEIFIEGKLKQSWLHWLALVIVVLLTVGSGGWIILYCYMEGQGWHTLREIMNVWFRVAGTAIACLMLLMVAVRASTSITNERDRDTLDALVTTPMSALEMLGGKLIGCLVSARIVWIWFGTVLGLAVITGGLHPLAVPLILVAWFIYALAGCMIGLWFSMTCKSSMVATFWTVMTTLFIGGGFWIPLYCCAGLVMVLLMAWFQHIAPGRPPPMEFMEYIGMFILGITPPAVFAFAGFSWDQMGHFDLKEIVLMTVFYLTGLFIWALASVLMWFTMLMPRFTRIMRRIELIYK